MSMETPEITVSEDSETLSVPVQSLTLTLTMLS